MKMLLRFVWIALLAPGCIAPADAQAAGQPSSPRSSEPRSSEARTSEPRTPGLKVSLELLSDTNGVDLGPFLKTLISSVKSHWLPPAGGSPDQPLPRGEATIDVTLAPDGTILSMRLQGSTHDAEFDKAAWSALTQISGLPLPAGMKDASLKLRVHFAVT